MAVKPKGCVPMVKRVYTPCEWAFTWNFEGLRPHPSLPRRCARAAPAHDPRASAVDSELKATSSLGQSQQKWFPLGRAGVCVCVCARPAR
eukprot:scaffold52800_cov41-Phaeocystis_antarctica.AAC.1